MITTYTVYFVRNTLRKVPLGVYGQSGCGLTSGKLLLTFFTPETRNR